jgi:recombination DNA repair RAD52 pathway protein
LREKTMNLTNEKTPSVSNEQTKALLEPIDPSRVSTDGKGFAHVEAWDIRRTLNAIFGFAEWSADVSRMELISEREVTQRNGKQGWNVVYRAMCTLRVGDTFAGGATYTEWAAGDATNPTLSDAHDQAIKTAESQALKRCAVNLGDQFGLSLYKNGSTDATVKEVIGQEHADTGKVEEILEMFEGIADHEGLGEVARRIPDLDISEADKARLRSAYVAAMKRLGPN